VLGPGSRHKITSTKSGSATESGQARDLEPCPDGLPGLSILSAAPLGIYELDGDTWKICLGLAEMSRSTDFVTTPGSKHPLETLRRGRANAEDLNAHLTDRSDPSDSARDIAGADGDPDLRGEWKMVALEMDGGWENFESPQDVCATAYWYQTLPSPVLPPLQPYVERMKDLGTAK